MPVSRTSINRLSRSFPLALLLFSGIAWKAPTMASTAAPSIGRSVEGYHVFSRASLSVGGSVTCPFSVARRATSMSARLFSSAVGTQAYRFTIMNDILPMSPDLTYSPVYTRMATDAMGDLYVLDNDGTGEINVYPPGSNVPTRSLEPAPPPGGLYFGPMGLATDKNGYFYYLWGATFNHVNHYGIYVFAPGASGSAPPVQSLVFGDDTPPKFPSTIAVGPAGDVFVLGSGTVDGGHPMIVAYKDFLTTPLVSRRITGSIIAHGFGNGITVDKNGELYLVDHSNTQIVVWSRHARGQAPPERTMTIRCMRSIVGHVVLLGDSGFVADVQGGSIYQFDKNEPGVQSPTGFVQPPAAPEDLAIGPL